MVLLSDMFFYGLQNLIVVLNYNHAIDWMIFGYLDIKSTKNPILYDRFGCHMWTTISI